jgi:hypothetical protein
MNENTTTASQEEISETVQVPISAGYFVTISREDYERVSQWKWTALPNQWTVYARRNIRRADGRQHSLYLHRYIMEPGPDQEVDHRDGNGLNCVRSNLRLATKSQQAHNQKKRKNNTSGIKGVSKCGSGWQATITVKYAQKWLGQYKTKEEAAAAYKAAAILFHKDFHKLE